MFSFSLQNLRRNPKDTVFFAFSIFITAAIITIFFCIINNPYFGKVEGMRIPAGSMDPMSYDPGNLALVHAFDQGIGSGIFTIMLSVLIIAICIMTIFFSHNFYLSSKTKDIAIMLMSGCSVAKLLKFLIVQNFTVIVIGSPIGVILGMLVTPILNVVIYHAMGLDVSPFALPWSSTMYALFTMFMISVWLVLLDYGFIVRSASLNELLKERSRMKGRKAKSLLKQITYSGIYIGSVVFILSYPVEDVSMIYMVYVGAFIYFGAVNVFRYVIPDIMAYLQRRFCFEHKHLLLSLANIQYSVANSSQLVTLVLLTTSILFYYLCKFQNDIATWLVVMFTYIVILVLVIACIIYKLANDALTKEPIYERMLCIGYLRTDLKKVIAQEVFGFYAFVFLVALPPLLAILYVYLAADIITLGFLIQMLGIFFVALLIGAILMQRIYCKLILHVGARRERTQE